MHSKGLRDDTTCIVVDILPQEKPSAAPFPQSKKAGKGMFKSMFRKKSTESSSYHDKEHFESDILEELFEEGSALLSERFVLWDELIILLYLICAACCVLMLYDMGLSIRSYPLRYVVLSAGCRWNIHYATCLGCLFVPSVK